MSTALYVCPCTATIGDATKICAECERFSRPYPLNEHDQSYAPGVAPGTKSSLPVTRILTAEEWLTLDTNTDERSVVIGSSSQPIFRKFTKNLVEAPEKSFKTSFLLRLKLGVSQGITVYSALPVLCSRRVLYVHGELSKPEIKERTASGVVSLSHPLDNFFQERDPRIHLIVESGQDQLRRMIDEVEPEDLVLDPWQAFIVGYDENEYKDVSRACNFVDRLIDEYKLTVDIATHTGKDPTRGTRGHSYLAGWRDTLTKLARPNGRSNVKVTVDPRWAAPLAPFTLEFKDGTLIEPGYTLPSFTRQVQSIRDVVEASGGKVTRDVIGKALSLTPNALRQALKRASDSGAIKLNGEDVTL